METLDRDFSPQVLGVSLLCSYVCICTSDDHLGSLFGCDFVCQRDAGTGAILDPGRIRTVDGKLIWAPIVQQPQAGKEGVLTGNGPNGLTQEEVERIMASLR